ncbi:hypothetical protein, partial [Paraglaciecola polaris]|uniref:hypothetical protein n=1 Tax=Paraglaciecola polaris TaxID=222814 RepID=UPI00058C11FE
MMDLFICHTPLQAKIALRVIETKKIKEYEVFYFTHVDNITQKNYYQKLATKAAKANFYVCVTRFPRYFLEMKKMFKGKKFNSVYVASIENIYTHLALTYSKFENLST